MMKMNVWNVNLFTVSMLDLFSWCLQHHQVDRMLLSLPPSASRLRLNHRQRDQVRAVYEVTNNLFGQYILDKLPVSAYPGVDLMGGVASAFVIEFNVLVRDIMLNVEPNMSRWLTNSHPPLPEDVCLFKAADSNPIFVSHTIDGRGWLISDKAPKLQGVSKSKDQAEGLFFEGEYFCRRHNKRR
jgi:hypothetical protein